MIKGIVSGHIYTDSDGTKDIELLTFINNDECAAFDDITSELLEDIDIGESDDYYFIAYVEAKFTTSQTLDGTEYDVEYSVSEIKAIDDIR